MKRRLPFASSIRIAYSRNNKAVSKTPWSMRSEKRADFCFFRPPFFAFWGLRLVVWRVRACHEGGGGLICGGAFCDTEVWTRRSRLIQRIPGDRGYGDNRGQQTDPLDRGWDRPANGLINSRYANQPCSNTLVHHKKPRYITRKFQISNHICRHPHVSFGSLWKSLGSGYTRNSLCVTNIAARTSTREVRQPPRAQNTNFEGPPVDI